MKKLLLLLISFLFVSLSMSAAWGHRYATEQAEQNPTINAGQTVTMSVEWGEGDWQESKIGYGTSTDGSDWTWVDINWFENDPAEGSSNKRCKVDITINEAGRYYYVYKFKKGDVDGHQYGSADWSENAAWNTESIVSYIDVLRNDYSGEVVAPTTAVVGADSIALNAVDGYEYAIIAAGGDVMSLVFQDDTVFNDLMANTSYDIYQRVKETASYNASAISEKLNVNTATVTAISEKLLTVAKIYSVNRQLHIDLTSNGDQNAEILVVNLAGWVLSIENKGLSSGKNELCLPDEYRQGIYIVNIITQNKRITKKIAIR